jgi:hypothetical protein
MYFTEPSVLAESGEFADGTPLARSEADEDIAGKVHGAMSARYVLIPIGTITHFTAVMRVRNVVRSASRSRFDGATARLRQSDVAQGA